jgi:hypothetical protein
MHSPPPPVDEPDATGPYDTPAAEDDLWFLRGPDDEDAPEEAHSPLPRANRAALFDPQEWRTAQDRHSGPLARVAGLFGALDERLRLGPPGWRQRLALIEAAELSWWVGDRLTADRIGLWSALHLAGAQDDSLALSRAGWAVRRLAGGPGPDDSLAAFLGRGGAGNTPPDSVADLELIERTLTDLHPITRAVALFHGWRMLGQAEPTQEIEAAVLAARTSAAMGRGGALFLPLAAAGFAGARAGGPVYDRLGRWLAGAERAVLAALMHLDRLSAWQLRAEGEIADLQGRTPGLLVPIFAAWPMVTAPMAQELSGASRASIQRNLDLLTARHITREVTGQGRYRVWSARL